MGMIGLVVGVKSDEAGEEVGVDLTGFVMRTNRVEIFKTSFKSIICTKINFTATNDFFYLQK